MDCDEVFYLYFPFLWELSFWTSSLSFLCPPPPPSTLYRYKRGKFEAHSLPLLSQRLRANECVWLRSKSTEAWSKWVRWHQARLWAWPTHRPSGSPLTKRLHVEEIPVVRQLEPEILVRKRKNMWWKNLPFVWKIQTLVIVVFYSFFLIILRNRWRNKLEKKDLEYSLWLKLFVICIFCLNFFDVQNWLSLGKSRVA